MLQECPLLLFLHGKLCKSILNANTSRIYNSLFPPWSDSVSDLFFWYTEMYSCSPLGSFGGTWTSPWWSGISASNGLVEPPLVQGRTCLLASWERRGYSARHRSMHPLPSKRQLLSIVITIPFTRNNCFSPLMYCSQSSVPNWKGSTCPITVLVAICGFYPCHQVLVAICGFYPCHHCFANITLHWVWFNITKT